MTNTIVPTEAAAVNPITVAAVDALRATWDAAVAAEQEAYHTSITHPTSHRALLALRAAVAAETVAHAAWKAGEAALQAQWREEDAEYDAALCARFDALDNATDYPTHYDRSMPIPYQITSYGQTYLDHHYATHSDASILAEGGDSPYGDGTSGWDQPAPLPSYYQGDTPDLDERDRQEKLAY